MVIKKVPETAENTIEYEVSGSKLYLGDDELVINLAKKERDDPVHLDICLDFTGGLVIGTGSVAEKYAAQIDIPAREYVETENEEGAGQEPVPFDINRCTLTLWELEV